MGCELDRERRGWKLFDIYVVRDIMIFLYQIMTVYFHFVSSTRIKAIVKRQSRPFYNFFYIPWTMNIQ